MIKNIPNKFTRGRLVAILDQHCTEENEKLAGDGDGDGVVRSEYDFVYLPIDFRTRSNYGYAFVNFTSSEAAWRLHSFLDGYRWMVHGSRKTCEVTSAAIQGLDALVKHFSSSRFTCDDEGYLPVRFEPARDGVRPAVQHVLGVRRARR